MKMVQIKVNNSSDTAYSPNDEVSTNNFLFSNIQEYFNFVEIGKIPLINTSNQSLQSIRNANGETLLIAAARCGHANVVENFINDIDVDETDNDGWTALLNASHQGHSDVVKILLNNGASIEQSDLMGWTSLMWACYKNQYQVVDELLKHKAHVNVVGEEDSLTPLIIAAGRGYKEIVQILLKFNAHVDFCDKFGSSALIWAARKGYLEIVEKLLNYGAQVDVVGMHASTALMLATRGNYVKVVKTLLNRDPNVNIVDYYGLSALGIAAREGYIEIAQLLIQSGAYVNTTDRFGNSILASAIRSGNIHLVRMLLDRHADVNAKDSESRTPLHLAIDKSYLDIVTALLNKKPNLELRNKDGETALLRAVKNRDIGVCQLLITMGAKISATDSAGDNALHLALRARSRRLVQTLLVNPSDSKLLYRPNRLGETPYSIDQESSGQPILPTIFGPIGSTDLELKNLFGYNAYADVLADVVCEPNLTLPLTIGLYAKWGSGKSLLLPKIRNSMKSFSRSWLDGMELYWSWKLIIILFLFCLFLTLCFSALFVTIVSKPITWLIPYIFGISTYIFFFSIYGFVYYGSEVRLWNGSIVTARFIARTLARLRILLSVLTLKAPIRTEKDIVVSPVSFLFAEDYRLSFIGGEQALTNIVQSLFLSAEEHYGSLAVRLFTAFDITRLYQNSSKLQTLCGIPTILYIIITIGTLSASLFCYILHVNTYELIENSNYKIAAMVFFSVFIVGFLTLSYFIFTHLLLNFPKQRIGKIAYKIHLRSFQRTIQKLQEEVNILVALIKTLNAFTNSQTRLVIMVDGLDSCEQTKMIQMLDALTLLFGSRQNTPFIVIFAVDPHIIISAIQQNLVPDTSFPNATSTLTKTNEANLLPSTTNKNNEITGDDYLRNVITMPFFLDHLALKHIYSNVHVQRKFQNYSLKNRKRSDTFKSETTIFSSHISLRGDTQKETNSLGDALINGSNSAINSNTVTNLELRNFFPTFDYFSNMNPRTMHRIVNSIALTSRLMRTFNIEFSWFMLYTWVSFIEQWPYRMGWIIEYCCSDDFAKVFNDNMTLSKLYFQIKDEIYTNCQLAADFDRNVEEFEIFLLQKHNQNSKNVELTNVNLNTKQNQDQLTVGHARAFSACTTNLDPHLKKQIRTLRIVVKHAKKDLIKLNEEDETELKHNNIKKFVLSNNTAKFLFGRNSTKIWSSLSKSLVKMTIQDVVNLIKKLNISTPEQQKIIVNHFFENNLNGLVLYFCDLMELKETLNVSLGDWTLIRLFIETLRKFKPCKNEKKYTKNKSSTADNLTSSKDDNLNQNKKICDSQDAVFYEHNINNHSLLNTVIKEPTNLNAYDKNCDLIEDLDNQIDLTNLNNVKSISNT